MCNSLSGGGSLLEPDEGQQVGAVVNKCSGVLVAFKSQESGELGDESRPWGHQLVNRHDLPRSSNRHNIRGASLRCLASPRTLGGFSTEARRANGNRAGSKASWHDPKSGHELKLGWRDVTVAMKEKRSVRGDLPILLILNDDRRWRHSSLWQRAV
jgi:hypothetical protein